MTRFRPGDDVFVETVTGYQQHNGGAFAEDVSVPQAALALKPSNITFEQTAAVPTSGLTALHKLQQGRLRPGQHVLRPTVPPESPTLGLTHLQFKGDAERGTADRAAVERSASPLLQNRRGVRMDRHAATRRVRHLAADAGVRLSPCTCTCCGTRS